MIFFIIMCFVFKWKFVSDLNLRRPPICTFLQPKVCQATRQYHTYNSLYIFHTNTVICTKYKSIHCCLSYHLVPWWPPKWIHMIMWFRHQHSYNNYVTMSHVFSFSPFSNPKSLAPCFLYSKLKVDGERSSTFFYFFFAAWVSVPYHLVPKPRLHQHRYIK